MVISFLNAPQMGLMRWPLHLSSTEGLLLRQALSQSPLLVSLGSRLLRTRHLRPRQRHPLPLALLREFVSQELLQHFDLVRAVEASTTAGGQVEISYPGSWPDLQRTLVKLAYAPDSPDPWRFLGLAMYEGPVPSSGLLAARARAAWSWGTHVPPIGRRPPAEPC